MHLYFSLRDLFWVQETAIDVPFVRLSLQAGQMLGLIPIVDLLEAFKGFKESGFVGIGRDVGIPLLGIGEIVEDSCLLYELLFVLLVVLHQSLQFDLAAVGIDQLLVLLHVLQISHNFRAGLASFEEVLAIFYRDGVTVLCLYAAE